MTTLSLGESAVDSTPLLSDIYNFNHDGSRSNSAIHKLMSKHRDLESSTQWDRVFILVSALSSFVTTVQGVTIWALLQQMTMVRAS